MLFTYLLPDLWNVYPVSAIRDSKMMKSAEGGYAGKKVLV